MQIHIGDTIRLRKKHPCGSFEWEVLRVGADFRLRCSGCGRQVMLPRTQVEKQLRGLIPARPEKDRGQEVGLPLN